MKIVLLLVFAAAMTYSVGAAINGDAGQAWSAFGIGLVAGSLALLLDRRQHR
jgi:hypothetical protein